MQRAAIIEDEFMLVRRRDGAKVMTRLFLTETGISHLPMHAHKENSELARMLHNSLESERGGRVSFGTVFRRRV